MIVFYNQLLKINSLLMFLNNIFLKLTFHFKYLESNQKNYYFIFNFVIYNKNYHYYKFLYN